MSSRLYPSTGGRLGGGALLPARVSQGRGFTDLFSADVDVVVCGVGEADVDEEGEGGEELGVDLGDGAGELLFLAEGEGDDVFDFVERHCGRVFLSGRVREVGVEVNGRLIIYVYRGLTNGRVDRLPATSVAEDLCGEAVMLLVLLWEVKGLRSS